MSTYNTKTVSGYLSIFTALISLIASGWIMAQTPAEADVADDVEEVLITGSLIKGTPEDAPNPVTAITEEDLRLSGNPSILQVMKNLPLSSGVDGSTNQFQSNGLEGSTNVNLRGLGPGRTLTLVNGQRRSYTGVTVTQAAYQPFVNLNFVPMAAVSRIEVLRDGASAIYGSDAISGVVNFITRSGFEGFEVSFGANSIEGSDGDTNLNLIWGKKLDETSNILVTFSNYDRGELRVLDRADTALLTYIENPQGGWSGLGNPGSLVLNDPLVPHAVPTAPHISFVDPSCESLGGTHSAVCRFNYAQYDNLIEEENGQQVYVEFNKEFDNESALKLVLNTGSVSVPEWATSPSYPPTASFFTPFATDHPALQDMVNDINANNYNHENFCTTEVTASDNTFTAWGTGTSSSCTPNTRILSIDDVVDGTYFTNYAVEDGAVVRNIINNATGISTSTALSSATYFGRALGNTASEPNRGSREFDTVFLSAAYDGKINDNIDYAASFLLEDLSSTLQSADMFRERFNWALQGFGGPNCIPANPTNPTDPTAGLTPGEGDCSYWNPLSSAAEFAHYPGSAFSTEANPNYNASLANSKELEEWMIPDLYTNIDNSLMVLDFALTGQDLFQLGGGGANWAAGAQYRSESYSADYPGYNNALNYPCYNEFITEDCAGETGVTAFLSPGTPFDLSQTVFAVFGELSLPFSDDLIVQTALRFEDYSESDSSFDYKFAGKYTITDTLSVRGSVSTSYKAPALSQISLFNATSLSYISSIGTFKAVDTSTEAGGLKPEAANNMNLGVIFNDDAHFFSADYWTIDVSDPIITESHSAILASACPDSVCNVNNTHYDRLTLVIPPDEDGNTPLSGRTLGRVAVQVINSKEIATSGIDFKYTYNFSGFIPQEVGIELSQLLSYELDGVDHVGQLNAGDAAVRPLPESKMKLFYNVNLLDVHNIRANYNSVSSYTDERTKADFPLLSQTQFDALKKEVDGFATIDLSYSFAFLNDRGTFNFTIFNLTDEDAPFAALDLSYDPYTANVLGQTTKLGINFRF